MKKDLKEIKDTVSSDQELPKYLTHLYVKRSTVEALLEVQDLLLDSSDKFESRSKVAEYLITLVRDNPSILKKYSHKKYKIF